MSPTTPTAPTKELWLPAVQLFIRVLSHRPDWWYAKLNFCLLFSRPYLTNGYWTFHFFNLKVKMKCEIIYQNHGKIFSFPWLKKINLKIIQTELRYKLCVLGISVLGSGISECQRHPGRIRRSSDTVPGGFKMCSEHAVSSYYVPVPTTATVLTSILLMLLLLFSTTIVGDRRQKASLDPICNAHTPLWTWSAGVCRVYCKTSAIGQEPWNDSMVQTAGQTASRYFGTLPVHLLLCIPSRMLTENGYSLTLCFLQKTKDGRHF